MLEVTAVVLDDEGPAAMPVLVLNTHTGATLKALLNVMVHAVAAVIPVIEPRLSVEFVATLPLPQVATVGAVVCVDDM